MTTIRTVTGSLVLGLALTLGAAASAGPPAKLQPSEPGWNRAERSFERFATSWMKKLGRDEATHRRGVSQKSQSYRGYTDGFETELRATGVPTSPFVGILRYAELTYRCEGGKADRCRVATRTPVTEIFRLEGERWIY